MTTARAIIKQGLRESNLIAIAAVPTDDQNTEGLDKLNSLIASVFGYEAGTKLAEWPVGSAGTSDYVASWTTDDWSLPPPNVRLMVTSGVAETILLPPYPDNGARIGLVDLTGDMAAHPVTLDPNGMKIEGAASSLIMNVNNVSVEWIFRADLGDWRRVTLLALDDDLPFPIQFDAYFETMLAGRMNPRYGRAMDNQTQLFLQRSMAQMRSTYRQTRRVRAPEAVLRRPNIGHGGIVDDSDIPNSRADVWFNR